MGHIPEISKSFFNICPIIVGGFRYGSFKTLKMASQVSLSIRLKVDLPMRYAKDSDCCDSPEARNHSVTASLSPAGIASRRLVSSFVMKGETSQRRWSYRSGDIRKYL